MRGIQATKVRRFSRSAALVGLVVLAFMAAHPAVASPMATGEASQNTSDMLASELSSDTRVYAGGAFEAEARSDTDSTVATSMIPVPEPSTAATALMASLGGAIYWCRRRFDAQSQAG